MKNYLMLLFISIFCIFCGAKNEDKTEKNRFSSIFCLKGNIDIRDYQDNFPPLTEEILTALTQWKVPAKNKLAIYLDSNQCIYVNRDLQGADNLQTLLFKFIQNNDTLDFYSESAQKACVFVYSNAFGEEQKMKEHLNIIKEIYDDVIENLRQVYAQRVYSKALKNLSANELERVNQAYPRRIYIYPFEHKEVYKKPTTTLESLRDSLNDNTIIRIMINSKYKILLEGELTTLERLEVDIKQYVSDTTKKEVTIRTDHNVSQDFIDKVTKLVKNSIDKSGRVIEINFAHFIKMSEQDN